MVTNETDYIASNGVTVRVSPALGYVVGDPPDPKTIIADESHSSALREYFANCESAPVTDLDVHVALNNFYDTDRTWEMWEDYQVEGMRRTLQQARFPAGRDEAETFKRVAEQRKRIEARLERQYGPPARPTSASRRSHDTWRALVDFLYVTQRRSPEPGIALSLDESNVLAWAILKTFKVRVRR